MSCVCDDVMPTWCADLNCMGQHMSHDNIYLRMEEGTPKLRWECSYFPLTSVN